MATTGELAAPGAAETGEATGVTPPPKTPSASAATGAAEARARSMPSFIAPETSIRSAPHDRSIRGATFPSVQSGRSTGARAQSQHAKLALPFTSPSQHREPPTATFPN
jgi:hypothetical protein